MLTMTIFFIISSTFVIILTWAGSEKYKRSKNMHLKVIWASIQTRCNIQIHLEHWITLKIFEAQKNLLPNSLYHFKNVHDILYMENRHFSAMLVGPIMPFWPILPIAARVEPVWLGVIPSHVKSLQDGLRHFDCASNTLWAAPLLSL